MASSREKEISRGELSPFSHQVAGHTRFLVLDGTTLCKPLIQRELHFYLNTPPDMRDFTPTYKGVIRVKSLERSLPEDSLQKVVLSADGLEQQPDYPDDSRPLQKHFLLLENVTNGFQRPCILDLKMGTRQHGDHAAADKRNRQRAKCAASTSGTLGVRLGGMQVYQVDTNSFLVKDKYYGRSLTEEGLLKVLHQFFHNGVMLRTDVLERVLEKLGDLRTAVQRQESFRFYSSSLLVTYEGGEGTDGEDTGEATGQEPRVDVRMIDFAHTTYEGYHGDTLVHSGPDNDYLLGMDNLVQLLKQVLSR